MKTQKDKIKYLEKQLKRYKSLSIHDPLTALFNRRKLEHDLERYLELQERHKVYFLIAMLDIDGFKKINDTKGHKEGDKILIKVAAILKKQVRKVDKVYRISGDEFVIILSHCKKDKVTKRIRRKLLKEGIRVSIGHNKLVKDVLEIVDRKMYEEKRK